MTACEGRDTTDVRLIRQFGQAAGGQRVSDRAGPVTPLPVLAQHPVNVRISQLYALKTRHIEGLAAGCGGR